MRCVAGVGRGPVTGDDSTGADATGADADAGADSMAVFLLVLPSDGDRSASGVNDANESTGADVSCS